MLIDSIGAGNAPAGNSYAGFGLPASIDSSAAKIYLKSDGVSQGNCAKIDPLTGDYVIDQYGNAVGDDSVKQMVYLAFRTLYNTSAVEGFGLDINTTDYTFDSTTETKINFAVKKAVRHLTSANVITLESISINRIPNKTGLAILIKWMDLSTGEINELTL